MDFTAVINSRRSIRAYDSARPVPGDALDRVLDAARIAPSACNIQPWHFIVVKSAEAKQKLRAGYTREWFFAAPVIIVGCVDSTLAWKRPDGKSYADVDLAIAFDHLVLAAENEGLGTCWIGYFDEKKIKEALGIPEQIRVIAMTPLGYPASRPDQPGERKKLGEIVHYEAW